MLLSLMSRASATAQTYTFQTPDCGGLNLVPSAINNAVVVVGGAFANGATFDSGLIYSQGRCTVKSFADKGTDFVGITNSNKLFGLFASHQEYELTAESGFRLLPAYPGAYSSEIFLENSSGLMAGNFYPSYHNVYGCGFFYENGEFKPLPLGPDNGLEGSFTIFGLNDIGVTVGTYNGVHIAGFVIKGGKNRFLTYPGASQTFINGINNNNIIVGTYLIGQTGTFNVFTYDLDNDIWTGLDFPAPYNAIHPFGISDAGVIAAQAGPGLGLVIATPPGN